ncbi:hypothetical protein ABZX39_17640 [Streptomyces collinus]|uniref:hypothetical protein n=1 Tax=Streptomyces collinus TaxID=42684 RepID=UPI0033B90F42
MYQLDLIRMRSAELRREAAQERLAREVARGGRVDRRAAAALRDAPDAETHTDRPRGHRLPRTA